MKFSIAMATYNGGDVFRSGFVELIAEVTKIVKNDIFVSDAVAEIEKLSGQVNIERFKDYPVELEAKDIGRIYKRVKG